MKERRLLQLIPARQPLVRGMGRRRKLFIELIGEALSFHKPGISIYSCKPYCISLLSQKKGVGREN